MSADGRKVPHKHRPLVACIKHSDERVERAVARVYPEISEEKQEDDL
jgi:hypothetical protein